MRNEIFLVNKFVINDLTGEVRSANGKFFILGKGKKLIIDCATKRRIEMEINVEGSILCLMDGEWQYGFFFLQMILSDFLRHINHNNHAGMKVAIN